jgi:glutathione S-transferase
MEDLPVKLYYSPNLNPRVAVAVAKYLGSPVEFVRADPQNPANTEGFRPLNPNALVPVLQEDDGRTIWEADAVACRLSMLAGSDFWRLDASMPDMIRWISWAGQHLNQCGGTVYFDRIICPRYGIPRLDPKRVDKAERDFARLIKIADDALDGRPWLLGERLSYADFRVATCLPFSQAASLPLDHVPNIRRLAEQLNQIEGWRDPFLGIDA